MRFAQADAGIQKQRVKRNIFRFGDLAGGSISKLIGLSDNKIFKSIIGV